MTNKEIAKTWFAAMDANEFDSVKKLMDKQHLFHNPMSPAPLGPDEHIGMMQQMMSALEGKHQVDLLIGEGEYVTVKGQWSGKHTGELMGVPASGKAVRFSWIDIFHVVNGKVVDEYYEFNPMSLMTQIGAAPSN